jgi:CheY-like chemotaxis protein/MinD-like ATPase involved in chromosome partitioning or flagellar assembly
MAEKILIVDDDMETLRLVGLMLQRQGYQIVAASNGTQALGLTRNEKPDLIVLDVMMPDMDGYEVTRQLRQDKDTLDIPIILFTAKSQVDDKVTGYEVGADDYLTKPVHPAELVAHIKALLSRGKSRAASYQEKAYTIGFIAAKGGLGVSSLALNLAITMRIRSKTEIIAAELRPGQGTWGVELGFPETDGLNKLLKLKPAEITKAKVENELVRMTNGLHLLMASNYSKDSNEFSAVEQMKLVLEQLGNIGKIVLLDIGTNFIPGLDDILENVNEIVLVTEPQPVTIQRTHILLDELAQKGFGKSKLLSLVLINRMRTDVQFSISQVQDALHTPVLQMVPPVPELAYQASLRNIPLIDVQPEGLLTQQFSKLAEDIMQHIQK